MRSFGHISVSGLRALWQRPGLWLALYACNLAFAALVWALAAHALSAPLQGRPEPDLFEWAVLFSAHPHLARWLIPASAGVLVLYLLLSTFLAGAVLARLAGGRFFRGGITLLWGMLRLRLLLWLLLAALAWCWYLLARWVQPHTGGFALDWAPALIQGLLALAFALPAALILVVQHFGQCLLVLNKTAGPVSAIHQALRLMRRYPGLCAGLWVSGWMAMAVITLALNSWPWGASPLLCLLLGQIAALLRAGVHLWTYATGREAANACW